MKLIKTLICWSNHITCINTCCVYTRCARYTHIYIYIYIYINTYIYIYTHNHNVQIRIQVISYRRKMGTRILQENVRLHPVRSSHMIDTVPYTNKDYHKLLWKYVAWTRMISYTVQNTSLSLRSPCSENKTLLATHDVKGKIYTIC